MFFFLRQKSLKIITRLLFAIALFSLANYLDAAVDTPSVTTDNITSIGSNNAICGGEVFSDGGSSVTQRGVCWATSENPTTDNQKTENGQGTGTFESSISNLTPGTTYYVRAYATNSVGTAYGEQRSFATLANLEIAVNGNGTTDPTPGIYSWAINETYKLTATPDKGYYFGSLPPLVFIEYEHNGKWKYKRCKLDKSGSYIFKNGYETASESCMKVIETDKKAYPLNYSQILVEYPKLPSGAKPSGYAILNNRISLVPVKLPQN